MDNKEKKQLNLFKSVQISKDNKEKYFKVQRSDISTSNKNNIININNQDQTNHIFITHKDKINMGNSTKKGITQNNNINGIFVTTNDRNKYNKNTVVNDFNIIDEKIFNKKLNLVHFESVKKLCDHLNQNFTQLTQDKNNIVNINEYLTQMYQNLQLLNRKIELITNKQTFIINKEDYDILNLLLNHLLYMNTILNDNTSKNIVNIYSNFKNFFGSCNCSM